MTAPGGKYVSQSTLALETIDSSKYPDTNKDFEKNIQRLNEFTDYIAQYLQTMQKGVDQANEDSLQKVQDFGSGLISLFGNGSLLGGIDFGDLQYYLPAIGALLGFDSTTPFPINLLNAAEHFFLGYIIPLDSWSVEVNDVLTALLEEFGIDPDFITAITNLLSAFGSVTSDVESFLSTIESVLGVFGLTGGDVGPFGDIWNSVSQLLGGFNISDLGSLVNPVFHALAPWISELATFVNDLDSIIKSFTGGVANLQGILNFASMFTGILDFLPSGGGFDVTNAWGAIVNLILLPFNLILGPNSPLNAFNIIGLLNVFNLPLLPISHLTNDPGPNLLVEPGFDDADSISLSTGWSYDSTFGHTSPGSAKVVGGNKLRRMDSISVPVGTGQVLTIDAWLYWTSITYTVTTQPITVNVIPWLAGVAGSPTVISPIVSPLPSVTSWQEVTGSYTVPSGVDSVTLSFQLDAHVAAGTVWFDDASLSKPNTTVPQGWIGGLTTALSDITAFAQDIVDTIITVIQGIPFVGGTLADLLSHLTGWHGDTVTTQTTATDTVATVAVVQQAAVIQQNFTVSTVTDSPRQPFWMCRHPISDVSFPEYMLNQFDVYGTTDTASTGTAHTHTIGSTNSAHSDVSGYTITNGNSRGVFIAISNTTVFDSITVAAWKGSGACTAVTYDLFRFRDDGSTYLIFTTNIAASLLTTASFIEVSLGMPLIVRAGESYLLRVSNQSAAPVFVEAMTELTGAQQGFATTGATLSTATSYTAAQMVTGRAATSVINWAAMFRATTFYTPKTYADDFNRPSFGALWVPSSSTANDMTIDFDSSGNTGKAAYGGTTNGDQYNMYAYSTSGDNTLAEADFWSIAGTARCGIFSHASRDFTQIAYLGVGVADVNLYTGALGSLGAAKATFASAAVDGTTWGIYVDDSGAHDIYHIVQNGASVASWTDSSDTMLVATEYCYGGLVISRASGVNAGEIDNWVMRDQS